MIRSFFKKIKMAIFWVYSLLRYISYKRVFSCFVLALSFCAVVVTPITILSLKGIGVSFVALVGGHSYMVSNPITLVSLSATFVTISLTLLGFALNNFAKKSVANGNAKGKSSGNGVNASALEETANILLVRYRGIGQTLVFLNVFCFPLLAKAFTLIIFLFAMLAQCFYGDFRIFYLIIYAGLMGLIVLSMLISVFQIYSDVNYSMFCGCKIVVKKMPNKIRYLNRTKNSNSTGLIRVMRRYIATDIYRGILLLQETNSKVLYMPYLTRNALIVKNNKKRHFLIEMSLLSGLSNDAMYGNPFVDDSDDHRDSFLLFFERFVKYDSGIVSAFKEEMDFIEQTQDLTYLANKDNIYASLKWFYDKINVEDKENGESK